MAKFVLATPWCKGGGMWKGKINIPNTGGGGESESEYFSNFRRSVESNK